MPTARLLRREVITAGSLVAERLLLRLRRGAPVLKIRRTTFDSRRQPFEYAQPVDRRDRYRFVTRLVREGGWRHEV